MLIGKSLNLDKARELALSGDLAGVAEEIKSQVGSQAEFEAMNVVQRKALADAMGLTVSDLGKMIAGEKTSAEMAEEKQKAEELEDASNSPELPPEVAENATDESSTDDIPVEE